MAGVNLVPLPRTPFDDQTRMEFVTDLQHALLRLYDIVIYTDCDEILVADPRVHASLATFLVTVESDVLAPTGLNLQHIMGIEAPIDLGAPLLGQRRFAGFSSSMCKPTIARVPLRWGQGFHWCDRIAEYRSDLFLFHLKRMDVEIFMERLRLTRSMAWSERARQSNNAAYQRESDEDGRRRFENRLNHFLTEGAAPFEFEPDMKQLIEGLVPRDGLLQGEFFDRWITEVPEAFFGQI